jgi:tight adherence protein B
MSVAVAVVLAGAAAALLVSPGPGGAASRSGPAGPEEARLAALNLSPRRWLAPVVAVALVLLVLRTDGLRLALGLVLLGAGAGVALLVARARAQRVADRREAKVVEVCEALVGELRAGQPPIAGLERCVDLWPELASVLAAARLGADVPESLRRLAARDGGSGLRDVAGAWQVSERSGAALSTALGQVAATARSRLRTRHLVRSELASANATARTVAVLPFVALGLAAGVGADPWHFLLGTPVGVVCLAAGAALALGGLLWIDRIARAVLR